MQIAQFRGTMMMNATAKIRRLKTSASFTLIELLVVVAIIAVLVALLLPAISKARESAKRVTCASQLRSFGTVFSMYADSNNGWFPGSDLYYYYDPIEFPNYAWPCILSARYLGPFETRSGVTRKMYYCPSVTDELIRNDDINWNYVDHCGWYRRVSYGFFCNIKPAKAPLEIIPTKVDRSEPTWVLGADIICLSDSYDLMSHREGNNKPAGGNILHVDSSVNWKRWANYDTDTHVIPTGTATFFYAW